MKTVQVEGKYRHFVTGEFKSQAVRMTDDDYSKALDSLVITCVDVVAVHKGEILLGKRAIEPNPDWWVAGGRMMPGESFEEAAARNVKRELGLDVEPYLFEYLNTHSVVWPTRAQPPQDHGCHEVIITMVLPLTNEEVDNIKPNQEYERLWWLPVKKVVSNHSQFHPALVQHARDVINFLAKQYHCH